MHRRSGFTLVELAIVLVIIGLIVGGVLVGRELVRQSQVRKLVTISTQFHAAIATFRLKYNAIPGEFFTYQSVFPTLVGPYCPKTSNMGLSNNNGLIDNSYEKEAAFAQLHAANLIPMGRSQILQDGTVQDHYDCFYNSMQQTAAFSTPFGNVYGDIVATTIWQGLSFGNGSTPVLTGAEALLLETKLGDDGFANTGRVRAGRVTGMPGIYCTTADFHSYDPSGLTELSCNLQIYDVN